MRKIKFFLAFCCLVSLGFLSAADVSAQKRKSNTKKKKSGKVYVKQIETFKLGSSVGNGSGGRTGMREPYLSLEPCAKETPEQISELENAPDKNKQLEILVKRIGEKDDWLRACSIYRLGEFRADAADALPVIVKLLRDEKNEDVWIQVEKSLWKIPPDRNIPLRQRLELAKNPDIYLRIYGVYSLSYFKPVAGTFESKDTVDALIEAARDEDITVRWMAVTGIRQQGFYGIDTSPAIPVLSELLQNGKINPMHPVRALIPMGVKAIAAAPILFDVLYNPQKYAGEKDENNRSYMLYMAAAQALAGIGKPLIPLLEKEFEKQPVAVLEVLDHLKVDGILPVFIKGMKHQNPEVRKKAIENLPALTSFGATQVMPSLIAALKDANSEVRNEAMSSIGYIAQYTPEKSDALREILKKQALPGLIANLEDKETACHAALNLPEFGADAEIAFPALERLAKGERGSYCAQSALYDFGEKGRKLLTKEQIERVEERKKLGSNPFDANLNKAKPIKPKPEPKPEQKSPEKTKDT